MLPERTGRAIGLALAIGAVLCFSLRPVLVRLAYRHAQDPVTLLALRMAFSLPFFGLAAAWQGRRSGSPPLERRDMALVAALGFIGYYLASFFDYLGLQYISAGLGRLVLFLYPTIVLLISALFLGKPIRGREIVALVLSYGGLGLALAGAWGGENVPLGAGLVFASAALYAVYLVGGAEVALSIGSIRFAAYATCVAGFCCLAQFLALRPLSALAIDPVVYGLSATIAVVCTVLPVFMTAEALRRIGANTVALLGALGPVAAPLWGRIGLDEPVTLPQILGGVLVVIGVSLVAVVKVPAGRQQ
jgi:drug/metabolite transporter (DMT)-like permease